MSELSERSLISEKIALGLARASSFAIGVPDVKVGKYISQKNEHTFRVDALTCLFLGLDTGRNAHRLKELIDNRAFETAAYTITRELHANVPVLFERIRYKKTLRDAAYKARFPSPVVESMSVFRFISTLNDRGFAVGDIALLLAQAKM